VHSQRILLTGGGTGGHVYPLLAIAEALAEQQPGLELHYLGSPRSEARIVPQFSALTVIQIEFHELAIRFSYRLPTPRNWGYWRQHILPLLGGRPFREAVEVVARIKPQLVIGSGGYVSTPGLYAAQQLGIPYVLLQVDTVVGAANAHFAPGAQRIYAGSARAAQQLGALAPAERVMPVGFPARRARLNRAEVFAQYDLDPARRLLVVMAGSLGAGAIARLAGEVMHAVSESAYADRLAVLYAGGERGIGISATAHASAQQVQLISVPYIADSVSALAAADFYLGRSGAATVAELVATGPQALLVPDPQHRDHQQFFNAAELVARGQGEIIEQSDALFGAKALAWLARIWNEPRLPTPAPRPADVIAGDILRLLARS